MLEIDAKPMADRAAARGEHGHRQSRYVYADVGAFLGDEIVDHARQNVDREWRGNELLPWVEQPAAFRLRIILVVARFHRLWDFLEFDVAAFEALGIDRHRVFEQPA